MTYYQCNAADLNNLGLDPHLDSYADAGNLLEKQ
jgi:hypothetical protein